jgi:hypothetical protein
MLSNSSLVDVSAEDTRFLPFAPDVAGEVASPRDAVVEVESKAFCWPESETQCALIAEPASQTLHA